MKYLHCFSLYILFQCFSIQEAIGITHTSEPDSFSVNIPILNCLNNIFLNTLDSLIVQEKKCVYFDENIVFSVFFGKMKMNDNTDSLLWFNATTYEKNIILNFYKDGFDTIKKQFNKTLFDYSILMQNNVLFFIYGDWYDSGFFEMTNKSILFNSIPFITIFEDIGQYRRYTFTITQDTILFYSKSKIHLCPE